MDASIARDTIEDGICWLVMNDDYSRADMEAFVASCVEDAYAAKEGEA